MSDKCKGVANTLEPAKKYKKKIFFSEEHDWG
jgi:hypothetical protein